ncbi:MAG: 16S rRNA (uracil(1498)-N(3))-methyltransferase [Gammaproteobacteria bacterium]|nr:16S rRNA (uracil(1498)-N(3))-methyltransferase [Gammaproteobacteria bacterium]MDH3767637.1 16S rRNA (uracil(1498)-N(3))-methyltransferase [Gammaproteobacteria bacterium]
MRTHRVYLDQPLSGMTELTVAGPTAHYLARVLRLRAGGELTVFDGRGGEYAATLVNVSRDEVQVALGRYNDRDRESSLNLTLAQGVARGERMDQILQKATELGVTAIVPLLTDHTVVRLDAERAEKRHGHWQRIIISACEQCGRNRLPNLQPLRSIDDWLADLTDVGTRFILQPDAVTTLAKTVEQPRDHTALILIGPEGGLSEREQTIARRRDFLATSLGPRVLRTETATLATLAIMQSRWGDAG